MLLDQSKEVTFMYHVSVTPTSYFIDPIGKVQYVKRGLMTKNELDQLKEKLMNELN